MPKGLSNRIVSYLFSFGAKVAKVSGNLSKRCTLSFSPFSDGIRSAVGLGRPCANGIRLAAGLGESCAGGGRFAASLRELCAGSARPFSNGRNLSEKIFLKKIGRGIRVFPSRRHLYKKRQTK